MRVDIGHDTHRLEEGRPLLLGGVRVEHRAAWPATAMPTWCCTPSPMLCSARLDSATSAMPIPTPIRMEGRRFALVSP